MAASALYSGTVFVPPLSHKTPKHVRSICFNPSTSLSRSRFCVTVVASSLSRRVFRVHGLMGDESGTAPNPELPNSEAVRKETLNYNHFERKGALLYACELEIIGVSIDLNLPRRSLLVQFTCCVCGERTKRLVNRLAYERGAVFVQCAGCLRHHKLVDNLGLITEYDFREKTNIDSETDRV